LTTANNEKQALIRELEQKKEVQSRTSPKPSGQTLRPDDYLNRVKFNQEKQANANSNLQKESSPNKLSTKKRQPRVKAEEVEPIGYELNLKMRIKGITADAFDKQIWPEKNLRTRTITIKEMCEVLKLYFI